jgi:urease beta subunit
MAFLETIPRGHPARSVRALAVVLLLAALAAQPTSAQGLGPRALWKAPADTRAMGTYLMFFQGNASGFNLDVPVGDAAAFDARAFLWNYTHFFNLFGRTNQASLSLLGGSLAGTTTGANPVSIDVARRGFADPVLFWDINLIGAPAMTLQEYAAWTPGTLVNLHLYMTAPLGSHDPDRVLNIGTDRWMFRVGPSLLQFFGENAPGRRTSLELIPTVSFFTGAESNVPFFAESKQDPLFKLEGHLTRDLAKGLWISADFGLTAGGATTVNGVDQDNSQTSAGLGLTVGYQITDAFELHASASQTLNDPEDGLSGNLIRFKFTYGWNPTGERMAAQAAAAR